MIYIDLWLPHRIHKEEKEIDILFQDKDFHKYILSLDFCNLTEITKVVLLNFTDSELNKDSIKKILMNAYYKQYTKHLTNKEPPGFNSLFKKYLNAKILTTQDLGIVKSENLIENDEEFSLKNLDTSKLSKLIQGKDIILSQNTSKLLARILLNIDGLIINRFNNYFSFLNYTDCVPVDDRSIDKDNPNDIYDKWHPTFGKKLYKLNGTKQIQYFSRKLVKIVDVKDFLNFIISYHQYDYSNKSLFIPKTFIDCFKNTSRYKNLKSDIFYSNFTEVVGGVTRKVIIIGTDNYIINNFVTEIERYFGSFVKYDKNISKIKFNFNDRIYLSDIDKLKPSELNNLILDINRSQLSEGFIMLHSSKQLPQIKNLTIKEFQIPSRKELKPIINNFVMYIFKKFSWDETDFSEISKMFDWNSNAGNNIFNNIASLEEIEEEIELFTEHIFLQKIDSGDIVSLFFWYDFKNYIEKKYPQNKYDGSNKIEERLDIGNDNRIIKKNELVFKHGTGAEFWGIEVNKIKVKLNKPIKYAHNIGLKYLAYLAHYCNSKKIIRPSNLREVIIAWHGKSGTKHKIQGPPIEVTDPKKSKDSNSKTPEEKNINLIQQALRELFNKYSELEFNYKIHKDFPLISIYNPNNNEEVKYFIYNPNPTGNYIIKIIDEDIASAKYIEKLTS